MAVVVLATLAGGYGALATFAQEKQLSVGDIRLSMSPGHRGALDIYVPLVDWGARFEAIRLPARLRIDLRTVDRRTVARVANGAPLDVRDVREEARDAIAGYLKAMLAVRRSPPSRSACSSRSPSAAAPARACAGRAPPRRPPRSSA